MAHMVYDIDTNTCPFDTTIAESFFSKDEQTPQITITDAMFLRSNDGSSVDTITCLASSQIAVTPSVGILMQRSDVVAGNLDTLVVHIESADTTLPFTHDTLRDRVFGKDPTDLVNPASILSDCSKTQLTLSPLQTTLADGTTTIDGVMHVMLSIPTQNLEVRAVENLLTRAVCSQLPTMRIHAMIFCVPDGMKLNGSTDWGVYSHMGGTRSVLNGNKCLYPAYTVHGIGHNLELGQSFLNAESKVGDGTCMMGSATNDLT